MTPTVTFFNYNGRVLLSIGNWHKLFESVSECRNYCDSKNIDPVVIPA